MDQCSCKKFKDIDLKSLRKKALQGQGIPQDFRSIAWKALLFYLPTDQWSSWHEIMAVKREAYVEFIRDAVRRPVAHLTESDHPLSTDPSSGWHSFFSDNDLLLQIRKDCRRLHPDMEFFRLKAPPSVLGIDDLAASLRIRAGGERARSKIEGHSAAGLKILRQENPCAQTDELNPHQGEKHWEVIERLMFVFTKLNPGQPYTQGMNEIVAPLYYVFATGGHHPELAEVDSFFCFMLLMSRVRDNFLLRQPVGSRRPPQGISLNRRLDAGDSSIHEELHRIESTLAELDPELYRQLRRNGVGIEYYGLRWLMLMFAQEFVVDDLVSLWDAILCVPFAQHNQFVRSIACALIVSRRQELMSYLKHNNFAEAIKLLQNLKPSAKDTIISCQVLVPTKNQLDDD